MYIYISLYPQNYGRLKVLYKNNTNNKPLNLGINCSIQLFLKKKPSTQKGYLECNILYVLKTKISLLLLKHISQTYSINTQILWTVI